MIEVIRSAVTISIAIATVIFVILILSIFPYIIIEATKDNPENFLRWSYRNILQFRCPRKV